MAKGKLNSSGRLVVIGGSAGSLEALFVILPAIKKDLACSIVIVLHRKSSNDSALAGLLRTKTQLKVKEAEEKDGIADGCVYLAPGDYHLLFEEDHTFSLDDSEKVNYSRPSIDVSFESAADVYGADLTCILLSGANADGTAGLKCVRRKGGLAIAQSPESAEVPYMPQQAIINNAVDYVYGLEEIIHFLNTM
ncbi:MAG: chemotaxis protein CheB [Bacteroidota bacterium]